MGLLNEALTIEKATIIDYQEIQSIDTLVLGDDSRGPFLREAIQKGDTLVARASGEVAGFAIFSRFFIRYWFIDLLVVRPGVRRRGIATSLIKFIERTIPGKKLFTSTNQSNTVAQQVYKANGFIESGLIDNLDPGDPEIVYYKRIP